METPTPRRRRFYKRKRFWLPATIAVCFVVLVGPWPIYTSSYQGLSYSLRTFDRIDALAIESESGPLRAGYASVDITPPMGEPLAGYGNRRPKESTAVAAQPLYARALSLSAGKRTVTIVGGDFLLFMPQLRQEVLKLTGLAARDVYFTSTHTHSGPGGYSSRWVDQLVLGDYDRAIFGRLAGQFANAIKLSRKDMAPADIAMQLLTAPSDAPVAVNRMDAKLPAMQSIFDLVTSHPDEWRRTASLMVCPAHATCYGASNTQANGDYLAALERMYAQKGPYLFAAGAVGSMGPPADRPRGHERAEALAKNVDHVLDSEDTFEWANQVTLASEIVEVDLPVQQYRFAQGWRLSPVAASYLHGRRTYIHVLRINQFVLLGMPADYSGELAMRLSAQAAATGLTPVVTSFNGDYVGYLLPQERYWTSTTETVGENLFGPWAGEYFNDICLRILGRMN